ncbi:MAG: hypothetical protein WAV76_15415 [Bacteroidota bacterium]
MYSSKGHYSAGIGMGMFFIIVGAALLAGHYTTLPFGDPWRLWPLILIFMGLGRLIEARPGRYRRSFSLIYIGSWLLACELNLYGLTFNNSWPIVIIGVGISIIWKSFYHPFYGCYREQIHENK